MMQAEQGEVTVLYLIYNSYFTVLGLELDLNESNDQLVPREHAIRRIFYLW